jgi:hypothetical protein
MRLSPLQVVPTDDFTSGNMVRLFAISAQFYDLNDKEFGLILFLHKNINI